MSPAEAVTCTAVPPAPLTDIIGTATWACTTGSTGVAKVTISVEAPNPYSSESAAPIDYFSWGLWSKLQLTD